MNFPDLWWFSRVFWCIPNFSPYLMTVNDRFGLNVLRVILLLKFYCRSLWCVMERICALVLHRFCMSVKSDCLDIAQVFSFPVGFFFCLLIVNCPGNQNWYHKLQNYTFNTSYLFCCWLWFRQLKNQKALCILCKYTISKVQPEPLFNNSIQKLISISFFCFYWCSLYKLHFYTLIVH